jgi:hypothetical protein
MSCSIKGGRFLAFLSAISTLLFGLDDSYGAEATWEFCVQVSVSVSVSPPRIILSWPQDTDTFPNQYIVYRKSRNATSWGTGATLPGSATSFTDPYVAVGETYEYQIHKITANYNGYGYIYTGIQAPPVDYRGKLILVVDQSIAGAISAEIVVLIQDLIGDGWEVIRRDVSRTETVRNVRSLIQGIYNADPANVKAVYLLGHVPVPYSGNIYPDEHVEHRGAWPADVYYGEMNGTWTDTTVNSTGAQEPRTRNVPGDGKFDQSLAPALELQVGRVDFANMPGKKTWDGPPTFPSETELL